jgi:hypothetical protein
MFDYKFLIVVSSWKRRLSETLDSTIFLQNVKNIRFYYLCALCIDYRCENRNNVYHSIGLLAPLKNPNHCAKKKKRKKNETFSQEMHLKIFVFEIVKF